MHIQKNSQKTIFEIGDGRKEGEIREGKKEKKKLTLYLVRSASRVETGFLSAAVTLFSASDIGVGWRDEVLYVHAQHTYTHIR